MLLVTNQAEKLERPVASAKRTSDRVFAFVMLTACVAILAYKFLLVTRLNINWDEFWYLSLVHELRRGELTLVLQGAYAHFFKWLPATGALETQQIVNARVVMVLLLAVTALLIWLLARHWLNRESAAVAPLAYLGLVPVLVHGGSFRSDSMLAPIVVGVLLMVVIRPQDRRVLWAAGVLAGLAIALTIKALLFAPMIGLALIWQLAHSESDGRANWSWKQTATVLHFTAACTLATTIAVGLHWLSVRHAVVLPSNSIGSQSVSSFATRSARDTLLNTPWFPRGNFFAMYARWQPFLWLMLFFGAALSAVRKRFDVTLLALALVPIFFYRNAFPYFYVVMAAPASVLAGYASGSILEYLSGRGLEKLRFTVLTLICLTMLYQPLRSLGGLWEDRQGIQRAVVAATHEIFLSPVNYIDRCGMISSFPKVNFFMSTWGLENYRAEGMPVFQRLVAQTRPAFLLINTPALAGNRGRYSLLDEDSEFIDRFFVQYWGPIKVAGSTTVLDSNIDGTFVVPYTATYRVESPIPLLISDKLVLPGQHVNLSAMHPVSVRPMSPPSGPIRATVVVATARPISRPAPPPQDLFTGL